MARRRAWVLFEWAEAGHARRNRIIAPIVGCAVRARARSDGEVTKALLMHTRTVFFISDGTGITAETFGNAILAQF